MLWAPEIMIPTVTRRRATRFVVVVVVFAMSSLLTGAAISLMLHGTPSRLALAASPMAVVLVDWTGQDEMESCDAGSSALCLVALGESFVPEVVPPAAGAPVALVSLTPHTFPFLPRIFRPPIG
jgi:hypothetical protein